MRVLHAARVSLGLGISSVIVAAALGSLLGLVAGYVGGGRTCVIMFCMDILLAFPGTLLAIAIVAMIGPGLRNSLLAISTVAIPIYARIARGAVLELRELEFVTAARALGGSGPHVVLRHIFPNSLPPLIVQTTLAIAFAILETAALGFLGLGAQPPTPEWGAMLADSYKYFTSGAWWVFFFPGAAIMLSVLGFNLLGDGLRDALTRGSARTSLDRSQRPFLTARWISAALLSYRVPDKTVSRCERRRTGSGRHAAPV